MAKPISLCDTAGMTNDRWLECRMHGPKGDIPYTVGGSDVAAIFGVSPWTTPMELWLIKKGRMKPAEKSNSNQLMMGHLLEPIAAYWYGQKTGNTVIEDTHLYQHADHPYALANFDRRFTRKSDGEPGILECKSCTYHKADEWADDAIPLYYEFQLRFYLAVADVNIGAFSAVWGNNPDNDLAIPEIVRDKAKEDMIFERLEECIGSWKTISRLQCQVWRLSLQWSRLPGFMVQARWDCLQWNSHANMNLRFVRSHSFRVRFQTATEKLEHMKRRLRHIACELLKLWRSKSMGFWKPPQISS